MLQERPGVFPGHKTLPVKQGKLKIAPFTKRFTVTGSVA